MKNKIKSLLRGPYHRLIQRMDRAIDKESLNQQLQRQIVTQYKMAKAAGIKPYESVSEAGFRCYSQFEEDGIILYILSMIGFTNKKVVEMCCGHGEESMSANLILNHGFDGFLFDGSESNVTYAKKFFASKRDCLLYQPTIKQAWITKDNVNDLLRDAGVTGDVDFFSLDIDGNDYWLWQAINVIQPRLLCFESHNLIPGDLRLTIKYQDDFNYLTKEVHEQDHRGASLAAMVNLSREKGYRMIGAHRHGFNVFFLRNDIAPDLFPEVTIEEVHNNYWTKYSQEQRWPKVKDLEWVKV